MMEKWSLQKNMKKEVKTKDKKPLEKHKLVLKNLSENIRKGMTMEQAMLAVGYSESYAKSSTHLKDTRSWDILLKEELADGELMKVHRSLLNSTRLDHMVFPPLSTKKKKKGGEETEIITDEMIIEFLESVDCKVKKIVHGEQARHVYFWSYDNQARDKALDKGYKLKGKYEPEQLNLKFAGFNKAQLIDSIMSKIAKKKQ